MSRERKYQVWDKKYGKMYTEGICIYADGSFDVQRTAEDGHAIETAESEGGELVLREYTGLRDREGREIYDGDIVLFDVVPGDRPLEKHAPKHVKGEVKLEPHGPAYGVWSERYCTNVKSIGNRFEHPELLFPTN